MVCDAGSGTRTRMARSHPILSRARLTSSAIPALVRYAPMKRDALFAFSYLGVVGQVLVALLLVIGVLCARRRPRPARRCPALALGLRAVGGFIVAAIATGGSLYYSQVMHFLPCELCWYQRICMYPLSITLLLIALCGR